MYSIQKTDQATSNMYIKVVADLLMQLTINLKQMATVRIALNTKCVKKWFEMFKNNFIDVHGVPWLFWYYIIDWNFPYMHALFEVYNGVTLIQYLNAIFEDRFSEIKANAKSYILSCVSHFVHTICRNCKK